MAAGLRSGGGQLNALSRELSFAADAVIVPRCVHYSGCGSYKSRHVARAAQSASKQPAMPDDLKCTGRVRPYELFAQLAARLPSRIGHVPCDPATLVLSGSVP